MIHLGLIGYPLGHSLSPKIHTAALEACDLQGDYSLFPIHPDDKQGLKDLLARVRSGEVTGLNVTIPHKQNVIELMDELTPTAKAIGAVNTIYLREDKLIGDNTDASGFLSDLKKFVNKKTGRQVNTNALILGAGGSARAVVYALLINNWNVTLAARRIEQAQSLTQSFSNYQHLHRAQVQVLPITNFTDLQPSTLRQAQGNVFDLIVNTTPLGMTPNIEVSPLPENIILSPHTVIYDLIYNPHETKLVKDARAQGLSATTGLGMLIEQAALAFELWTGHTASREAMFQSVNQ